jgi:hypothetical protein
MPRASKTDPQIVEMPTQTMAVVRGKGKPDEVFPKLMPALYGAVYTLKFDLKKKGLETFKVGGLRGRYPNVKDTDKQGWDIVVGLAIPDGTKTLFQKVPDIEVKIEKWRYGTVAQLLHLGSYSEETANIERLLKFIDEQGYEVVGDHEEEYLSSPAAKVPKTVIRYLIKEKNTQA